MSSYQIGNLIINLFTAIGTCGATIVALLFSLKDRKIQLKVQAQCMQGWGTMSQVESDYLVVTIINKSYMPITLDMVGLRLYKHEYLFLKSSYHAVLFPSTEFGTLPMKLEFGERYLYQVPIHKAHSEISKIDPDNIIDLKLVICIRTAKKDVHYKIEKECKRFLLKRNS